MRFLKIAVSLLAAVSVLTVSAFGVAAETRGIKLSVGSVTAVPGDEVAIPVDVTQNDGIMAMTFAVSYDTAVLEYKDFNMGVFNDYTVVDHPDKGYVSFVNCEKKDRKYTGNVLVLKFAVKDDAAAGNSDVKIVNVNPEKFGESLDGCFATWDSLEVAPEVSNGSVAVGKTCANSGHSFGKWTVISEPLCETDGINGRSCTVCGHTETKAVPALGHDYSADWTVDEAATAETDGSMSRHCKRCDKTTDKVSFKMNIPEEKGFENAENTVVPAKKWDKLEKIAEENKNSSQSQNSAQTSGTEEPQNNTDAVSSEAVAADVKYAEKSSKRIIIIAAASAAAIAAIAAVSVILANRKKS